MAFSVLALAQNKITVKGTVKDSAGEPVTGAVIMLEGSTTAGSVTDIDGNYTITFTPVAGKKPRLAASCLSYKTVAEDVAGRSVINFTLEDDSEKLDEVVVVGYGSMRRSDLTGSVTSVKIDETQAGQSASLDQLLSGRAAGVQVTSNSASPDGGVSILIRGSSSFNGSNEPLYVVDGIILNTSTTTGMGAHLGNNSADDDEATNGLMGINPQDIASIEVLKDASATAIYGSQGANGVIIITTKTANNEKPVINFSAGVDISTVNKKQRMLDFYEYVDYCKEVADSPIVKQYNSGLASTMRNRLQTFLSDSFFTRYELFDWQDYLLRSGVNRRYYLSISGKPKKTSYMFSVGYNNVQGIIKTTGLQNITTRLNLDRTLGKKVTIGTRSSFSYLQSQLIQGAATGELGAATSLMRSMITTVPYNKILETDEDGDVVDRADDEYGQTGPNRWLQGFRSNKTEYRINPSVYAQYKITPWLTFKTTAGADLRVTEQDKFKSRFLTTSPVGATAANSSAKRLAWNWDNYLMFNKRIKNKHNISGTLGMTMSENTTVIQNIEGEHIEEWKAMEKALNAAAYAYFSYSESTNSLMSFYLRGIYSYRDRYVLTATFRTDGSSHFVGKNKWGYFPSFAFAWRMNQEPWFNIPAVSMAKLRIGWGQVGNQWVSAYSTIYNYTTGYRSDHSNLDSQRSLYTTTNNLPNADLKWETTEQTNLGLDLGLFKGRLTFTADLYYKLTKDLLQTKKLAPSSGLSDPYVNMGSIENKGLEFTLDAVPVKTKDFEWMIGGNVSFNRNKILSINPEGTDNAWMYIAPGDYRYVSYFTGDTIGWGNVMKTYLNIFIEGQPMCMFYGIPTDGLVKEGQVGIPYGESDTSYRGPGAVNYIDVNGDGYISEDDRVIIGNPNPKMTYGFHTSLRFKNFTLTANFIGSYGNDLYNVNLMNDANTTATYSNIRYDAVYNQWTPLNQDTFYPTIGALNGTDVKWASDRYVEDGSYLRLSDLSLSYNLKIKNKSSFVRNINFAASAGNLFVWTHYSGYDPNVNSYGSMKRRGADMGSYPSARSLKFDLKFTF